jgi:hypothetical protein
MAGIFGETHAFIFNYFSPHQKERKIRIMLEEKSGQDL